MSLGAIHPLTLVRLLIPAVVISVFILSRTGVIDGDVELAVFAVVEGSVILFVAANILIARRHYRSGRQTGLSSKESAERTLQMLLPDPLAALVLAELTIWASIFIWITRRRSSDGPEFGYTKRSILGPIVVIAILARTGRGVRRGGRDHAQHHPRRPRPPGRHRPTPHHLRRHLTPPTVSATGHRPRGSVMGFSAREPPHRSDSSHCASVRTRRLRSPGIG